MYSRWRFAMKYLQHFITSSNGKGHGIHSPFIYRYIRDVLNDRREYPDYSRVEELRKELEADKTLLQIDDLGAGSVISGKKSRTVASLARHAVKSPALGQLLYRTARFLQPSNIIELGTSLGITTTYLALASPGAQVYTIEGAGEVAGRASSNFSRMGIGNVTLVQGNFDDQLAPLLNSLPSVDLFFLDGNHRRESTLEYFSLLVPKMNNDSVMIFDDIHWSGGMEEAWKSIKDHGSVQCTVDLFWMGLAFFRREFHEKQHFRIRF